MRAPHVVVGAYRVLRPGLEALPSAPHGVLEALPFAARIAALPVSPKVGFGRVPVAIAVRPGVLEAPAIGRLVILVAQAASGVVAIEVRAELVGVGRPFGRRARRRRARAHRPLALDVLDRVRLGRLVEAFPSAGAPGLRALV